jgi:glycolate oxidase iron-sulfur subunit
MSADQDPLQVSPLGALLDRSLYTESLDCVHCGLCLTSCPTYRATGRETASPRGRIYLMRGVAEGRLLDTELLEEEAFQCLGCRACETACPSGVQYGAMLEQTRHAIRSVGVKRDDWSTRIERFALRRIVPSPSVLRLLFGLLSFAQTLGLDRLTAKIAPRRLADMMALLPTVPPAAERARLPAFTKAEGPRRGRVALFEGCVMPELFGRVNDAARRVLSRAGYDVIVPPRQGCCGALQAHSGDLDFARGLALRNADAFRGSPELDAGSPGAGEAPEPFDAIIVTSAGCSAALREAEHWIGEAGGSIARGTRDVLEFLDEVDASLSLRPLPLRVCYDDPCHLVHAQGIASAPRRLLQSIPELTLVAHRDPEACCGAAGIYNLTQPEMSARVLSPKIDALAEADPQVVATANPGCAMQLAAGLEGRGIAARVVHPIELIEEASRSSTAGPRD